jgi:phosphoketolase
VYAVSGELLTFRLNGKDPEHPHGLSDMDFDELFTKDKPVIFAFHAYPWLIHRLTYRRTNHDNIHVRVTRKRVPSRRHLT